jgi:hypothetical protein
MGVNVNGAPLEWVASLDTTNFLSEMDKIEAKIKTSTDDQVKHQALLQKGQLEYVQTIAASANSFTGLDTNLQKQISGLVKLQDELKKVKEAQSRVTTGVSSGDLSSDEGNALLSGLLAKEKELTATIKEATSAINKQFEGTGDGSEKLASALTRLRNLKNELIQTDSSSPAFDKLLTEATELEQKIKNVNRELELSSSNTAGLEALKLGVRGLIGGFEALSGAVGLFSENSETVKRTTESVVAAMGLLNGIEEVGAALSKEGALNTYLLAQYRKLAAVNTEEQAVATEALVGAQEANVAATEGAAAATLELDAAMDANPAGVLLLALTAIVVAYQAFASNTKDASEEQKNLNEALANANKLVMELVESEKKLYEDRTQSAENELSLAQAQGKSEEKILQLRQKVVEAKRTENIYVLARLGYDKNSLELGQAELDLINEKIRAQQLLQNEHHKLNDEEKAALETLKAQKEVLESTLKPAQSAFKAIQDADAETKNLRAEQAKKEHDDNLKSIKGEADARLLYARKNSKEELDARIADIQAAAKVELDNVNLTSGERKRIRAQEAKDIADAQRDYGILQLNNQKALIQARLDEVRKGSAEELALRIDLLNKTAQIERAQNGVTKEQRAKINADLFKAISEANLAAAADTQKQDIEIAEANIKSKLDKVRVGSEEELNLRKELISKAADLEASALLDQFNKGVINEKLFVAKVREINDKERADRKAKDDAYYDNKLKREIALIENSAAVANVSLNETAQSPLSSASEKFEAQKNIIKNNLDAVQKEINKVGNNIIQNRGDVDALEKQLDALILKKDNLQSQNRLLDQTKQLEDLQNVTKGLSDVQGLFSSLATSVEPFNQALAETLKILSSILGVAGDVSKVMTEFAKGAEGNPIAMLSAGADAVATISKLFAQAKESAAKAKDDIANFNLQILKGEIDINLQYRERLRTQQQINDLTLDGIVKRRIELEKERQDSLSDYNRILKQIQEQSFISGQHTETTRSVIGGLVGYFTGFGSTTKAVNDMSSLAGKSFDDLQKLFLNGQLDEKAKSLFEELQKLKQEGADIDAAIEENKKKAQEVFTATTADNILDSIVQAFADGKKATADFADNFEGLMRQAILNSFKYQTLEKPLKDFYDQFAGMAQSDNKLTAAEIERLRTIYNSIISNAATQFDQLQQLTNINLSGAGGSGNTLAGAIKGMSEQQADLLAGQFNGLRLTAFDQLNVAKASLLTLNQIENNTASMLVTMNGYYSKWDRTGLKVV